MSKSNIALSTEQLLAKQSRFTNVQHVPVVHGFEGYELPTKKNGAQKKGWESNAGLM